MGVLDGLAKAVGESVKAYKDASGDDEDEFDDGGDVSDESMQNALSSAGLGPEQAGLAEPTEEKPRGLFHDPYSVMDWGGWREKPTQHTYETLRQMAQKNVAIAAIIQVRTSQIGQHAKPQQDRYDKGFNVQLRDRRDQSRTMSDQEQSQAAQIERMLETTGFLLPNERPSDRDSFRAFLKKGIRDILIYDQWCFEKIRDRRGKISRFIALPSETIRPAVADIEHMDAAELRNRVSHVQVYEDTVIAEFSPDDLAWGIMNPRSDLRSNTFGFSAVEQLTSVITSWLFGYEYNTRFFTQGSAIKGLLNIKGAIPDRQMKSFRRLWYSMVSGINNSWRTPIVNSEDVQFLNMHSTNREMEFSSWLDLLLKLSCAVFGMDPMEINFIYGNTGSSGGLNQSRPRESELAESKDKGLVPLMEHIEDMVNSHIIWELNPDFEFKFVGLNAKEEGKQREAWDSESKAYKTIDEVRAEMDLPPLTDGTGNMIRDSVWLQNKQAADQAEQGEDDQGDDPFGGDGPMDELPGDDVEGEEDTNENEFDGDEEEGFEDDLGEDEDQDQDQEGQQPGKDPSLNNEGPPQAGEDQEPPPGEPAQPGEPAELAKPGEPPQPSTSESQQKARDKEQEDAEKAMGKLNDLLGVSPRDVLRKSRTKRTRRNGKQIIDIVLGDNDGR